MNAPGEALRRIRSRRPLVHVISNIVTANDCANLLLCVGASPMMAQAEEEMEEISALSSAAVLNCGTPDAARFALCGLRGELANRCGQPVVLDPVGAGASNWRLAKLREMLQRFTPTILHANLSEARALLGRGTSEHGVDSTADDDEELRSACARELADAYRCVSLLSGSVDFVSDGRAVRRIPGGSEKMMLVTGSGCMLSALCGAFAAVETDTFRAATLAASFWKRCAEIADREAGCIGSGSFRIALIDAATRLSRSA